MQVAQHTAMQVAGLHALVGRTVLVVVCHHLLHQRVVMLRQCLVSQIPARHIVHDDACLLLIDVRVALRRHTCKDKNSDRQGIQESFHRVMAYVSGVQR